MGTVAFTDIQKFAADVAHEFLPEKVILFGSYARGNAGAESDVDLLVVMPGDVSGTLEVFENLRGLTDLLDLALF